MATYNEELIAKHMKNLQCTREEAISVIEDDIAVDHMKDSELTNDLTAEQKKAVKLYKNDSEKAKKTVKREKNPTKKAIIDEIFTLLNGNEEISCENVSILTEDRLISFSVGDDNFEIVLQKKNKSKNNA